jgi:hypothetical protein
MESGNNVKQNGNITVSELELLVSWMYGSMSAQTYALCRDGVRASKYHMIFPVREMCYVILLSLIAPSLQFQRLIGDNSNRCSHSLS